MQFEIRPAGPHDIGAIQYLLSLQFGEHANTLKSDAIARAVEGLVAKPQYGTILLASKGAVSVGIATLSFTWTLEHGGLSAWLDELYVIPQEREHGVGTLLAEAAIAEARRNCCMAIDLEVEAGHERAEKLYQRLGFNRRQRQRYGKRLASSAPENNVSP